MSEIKPCPFCGEDEIVCYQGNKAIGTPNALYWYKIVCMKCFCQTGERSENLTDVKKLLAEDWNTRPIEDELRARVKELEAWQKEALPFIEAECGNLSDCLATSLPWEESIWVNKNDFMTKELYEDIESVNTENHRLLVSLIKQAEDN